ncbi:MAG: DHA2 family efflux MFS transporter permease subunit [Vulcanimicrobiaceae bacterium]
MSIAPPQPAAQPLVEYGFRRIVIVAGVMLAALLQTVDATIVNVALPTIQGNLGATVDEGTWVVTAYVIANVVVIPLTPWLQMRFGRKQYFLVSIVGFTIASMLCGIATTLPTLIVYRIIQGAFGGGLLATAQVILRDTFPPEQLGTSQAIYAMGVIVGPSIGPTLGGIITDNMSWPWVFDVNILPGIAATILLALYVRGGAAPKRAPIDIGGVLLLVVAVGSLQYVLDQGQLDDWFSNAAITVCSATAVLGFASFVYWELRHHAPVIDLRILRHLPVAAACVLAMINAVGIFGVLLLLPQFTVDQLGFTSTLAGLLIGARALPIALLTIPIGGIANGGRIDLRYLIGAGLATSGLGCVWLAGATTTGSDMMSFVPALALCGIGIAFVFSPLLVATLRSVAGSDAPKAAAFVTLSSQLGGSIASASLVTLVDRRLQLHQTMLASTVTRSNPSVAGFLQHHSLVELYHIVTSQATTLAYADAFLVSGLIAILCSPLVVLLKSAHGTRR